MAWNKFCPAEECQVAKSRVKKMIFFSPYAAGIIHREFVP
jgi:hypothetical protein